MKILITHYVIIDYGGLVNDAEIMTDGFRRLGHEVDHILLMPHDYGFKAGHVMPNIKMDEHGIGTGLPIHHRRGWAGMDKWGFGGRGIAAWKAFACAYDLIIHQNPVPTRNKTYAGASTWKRLYNVPVPQIVISPDANFQDAYPHLLDVIGHITGVVCTHEASFRAAALLPVPRVLLPGPHMIRTWKLTDKRPRRQRRVFSIQNFKPIKRVEEYVKAIPHMRKSTRKTLAGGGIEHSYMTAGPDKVKPQYVGIWDAALEAGMEYVGYIPVKKVNHIMERSMILLDCSWSKRYTAIGPHFNRTFIEAMNNGCIPVCTDLGMRGSDIFKPDVNYIEMPARLSPAARAGFLESVLNTVQSGARDPIRRTNFVRVADFDHLWICEQFICMMSGEATGLLGVDYGHPTAELERAARESARHFK